MRRRKQHPRTCNGDSRSEVQYPSTFGPRGGDDRRELTGGHGELMVRSVPHFGGEEKRGPKDVIWCFFL